VGPNQIRSVEFGINNSASTNTKIYLGKLTSVTTPILDTGTGTLYEVERATTDTLTNKTYRGTLVTSDQGTACTNGELALSAGWGTTATVTAVVGISQTCKWTITSAGTGQAANPTVTDTLTNALPSASVVCEMRMTGGTGTATLFDQTTSPRPPPSLPSKARRWPPRPT